MPPQLTFSVLKHLTGVKSDRYWLLAPFSDVLINYHLRLSQFNLWLIVISDALGSNMSHFNMNCCLNCTC